MGIKPIVINQETIKQTIWHRCSVIEIIRTDIWNNCNVMKRIFKRLKIKNYFYKIIGILSKANDSKEAERLWDFMAQIETVNPNIFQI